MTGILASAESSQTSWIPWASAVDQSDSTPVWCSVNPIQLHSSSLDSQSSGKRINQGSRWDHMLLLYHGFSHFPPKCIPQHLGVWFNGRINNMAVMDSRAYKSPVSFKSDAIFRLCIVPVLKGHPICVGKCFAAAFSNPHVRHDSATSATVEALVSSDLNWEMGIRPEQYLTPQWISLP